MASYAAISVIANTLRGLFANSVPAGEFAGAEFKLLRTQDFQDPAARVNLGLSIYLHRIDFNTNRRSQPPRINVFGERFRPPTALDLHFVITAWGPTAEKQMDLLAWAIRTLQDTPQLPAGLLNRFSGDRPTVFADSEAVELVGEILTAQDFVNLWGNTLANQQPSIGYLARQVLVDSETAMPDAAPVQTRQFDLARPLS
jgi:hypothetical protein